MQRQATKKSILDRYGKNASGDIVIDVATHRVEDLYNTFDRFSPDARKDLNADLVTYVLECAREIGDLPFVLRINIASLPGPGECAIIRTSFRNFFSYLANLEERNMVRRIGTSGVLLSAGLVLLILAIITSQQADQSASILINVFAEGLTVAAWVALWQALATYLIHWAPYRRTLSLYRRLAETAVEFLPTAIRAGNEPCQQ